MPLISVYVTVYNLKDYISQCLDSILSQDFDDFEVIVADNGSTDGSVEICEEYEKKYSEKMRFIKFPLPTVLGRAHNAAIDSARGEYIQCVDGDDYIAPGCLKSIGKIIESRQPDLIMGTFQCIVEEGATAFNDSVFEENLINNVEYEDALDYLMHHPNFHRSVWRFVAKKRFFTDLYLKNNLTRQTVFCDTIAITAWLFSAKSIYFYKDPFYFYRRRTGAVTLTRNGETTSEFIIALATFISYIAPIVEKNNEHINAKIKAEDLLWYIKLFLGGYDLLNYNDFVRISEFIDMHKSIFQFLDKFDNKDLKDFLSFINKHNSFVGLKLYCEYENARLLDKLKFAKDKNIYVFPTGRFGEGTGRLLIKNKFNLKGFFDNDAKKNNTEFLKLPCYLPDKLKDLTLEEKNETVIVISTIYDKLFEILRYQVYNLGIPKENIIIRK